MYKKCLKFAPVSEAKTYLYQRSKIGKAGRGSDDQPPIQTNSSRSHSRKAATLRDLL